MRETSKERSKPHQVKHLYLSRWICQYKGAVFIASDVLVISKNLGAAYECCLWGSTTRSWGKQHNEALRKENQIRSVCGKGYLDPMRESHISINNHVRVHLQGPFVQPYVHHANACTARKDPETAPVGHSVIGRFVAKHLFQEFSLEGDAGK